MQLRILIIIKKIFYYLPELVRAGKGILFGILLLDLLVYDRELPKQALGIFTLTNFLMVTLNIIIILITKEQTQNKEKPFSIYYISTIRFPFSYGL